MNIKEEAKQKIVKYILKKNLMQTSGDLPEKGEYNFECKYELGYNKNIDDIIFVKSLNIEYFNYSMKRKWYGLYAFDLDGNLIENYRKSDKFYNGFFNHLEIVQDII